MIVDWDSSTELLEHTLFEMSSQASRPVKRARPVHAARDTHLSSWFNIYL